MSTADGTKARELLTNGSHLRCQERTFDTLAVYNEIEHLHLEIKKTRLVISIAETLVLLAGTLAGCRNRLLNQGNPDRSLLEV